MKKLICPHKVILPSFLNGAIFNLFCSGLIFDFLTKCNVPSLDRSVAAGAALGVQLDPALLAHGVTVHTLPDAHRGPHLLNTVNKTESMIFAKMLRPQNRWDTQTQISRMQHLFHTGAGHCHSSSHARSGASSSATHSSCSESTSGHHAPSNNNYIFQKIQI